MRRWALLAPLCIRTAADSGAGRLRGDLHGERERLLDRVGHVELPLRAG